MTDVRLESMTEEQYRIYRGRAEADYAAQIAESGSMSSADASRKATEDYDRLLPDGIGSAGQFLFTAYSGDDEAGILWLQITSRSDGPHAYGFDFWVRPELRRHGYGRSIMLAALELCRERGVVSVGLNVFGFNLGARSLYEQMGFEATAIQMTKRLTEPAVAAESGVRLEPMTAEQYAVYLPLAQEDYALNISRSGAMAEADAKEKAAEDFARWHSAGVDPPGRLLLTAYDGELEVGLLGLRLEERSDGLHAFGFDFRVTPELQRQGYGRSIMVAAEQICRERAVVSVGLSVFGFNQGARSLYEQLGFEVTAVQMIKRL